jgi:hypothetical protein
VRGQAEALGQVRVEPDDLAAALLGIAQQDRAEFPGPCGRLGHGRPHHLAQRGEQQADNQAEQAGQGTVHGHVPGHPGRERRDADHRRPGLGGEAGEHLLRLGFVGS